MSTLSFEIRGTIVEERISRKEEHRKGSSKQLYTRNHWCMEQNGERDNQRVTANSNKVSLNDGFAIKPLFINICDEGYTSTSYLWLFTNYCSKSTKIENKMLKNWTESGEQKLSTTISYRYLLNHLIFQPVSFPTKRETARKLFLKSLSHSTLKMRKQFQAKIFPFVMENSSPVFFCCCFV